MQTTITHIPALKNRHVVQKVDSKTDLPMKSLTVTLLNSRTISFVHATHFDHIHPPIHPSISCHDASRVSEIVFLEKSSLKYLSEVLKNVDIRE